MSDSKFYRHMLTAGCSALAVAVGANAARATDYIAGDSLLISTTTYQDVGKVANLVPGVSQLPGANAGQTSTAVSSGALNTVWNNEVGDPSFGVTSAISLSDLNVNTGAVLASTTINPSIVSTSFSSKSELGLNLTRTSSGYVATFMGYAGGGVGNLDVSNSDTTAFKDTTNPVTSFFAPGANQTYAFNRSVVAFSANGSYTTTQTLAYGGNNGRSALLAPNGLYYTVGNSNNGSGTPTQLTTSTGLEVATPGSTPNSTMIDPTFKAVSKDKAGKSSNFRGLTYYDGNLYFTKGSGSNGIDTVYTVSNPDGQLPTSATANDATVSILPGFPTDSAKATGGDYTPFGLFFANPTTLYVADEGTGNATDAADHAGLEKWTLSDGTWSLDYTLQDNLIGQMYSVQGWNYLETTSGLRNLTGEVNANGTVTLWATTATTSASGDNGADPNEIVEITDALGDTSLPTSEQFSVYDGPQLGLRYGGVAFAAAPEPSTWAMLLLGFGGLGFAGYRKRSALSLG
jgi:PEP-CTERM motif